MSMEKKDYQIDVVHALQNVMEIVLKYLDSSDLISVAEVCTSWQEAVLREQEKRIRIQKLDISHKNYSMLISTGKLQKKRYVSLYIYADPKNSPEGEYGKRKWETYFLEELKKIIPNKKLVSRVAKRFTKHSREYGGETEQRDVKLPPSYPKILGLFVPNAQQSISIRAAYMWDDRIKIKPWNRIPGLRRTYHEVFNLTENKFIAHPCVTNYLTKELGSDDCKYPKSTILVIGSVTCLSNCIFELCKREQQNGKEVTLAFLWGHNGKKVEDDCPNKNHKYKRNSLLAWCRNRLELKKMSTRIILRISGPSFESWSTFIYMYATNDEIERKLHQLKEKVKHKRYITGMFSIPYYAHDKTNYDCKDLANHPCDNAEDMLRRLKRIFPDIPFMGNYDCPYDHTEVMNGSPQDNFDENDVTKSN